MKDMLKMRLPKTKVYFFLMAFSMGSVIFYISYQNANISVNNGSTRVTRLRNQKPGFTNRMLTSTWLNQDRASNDQHSINISHILDTIPSEVHLTNSKDKVVTDGQNSPGIETIKTADSFDLRGPTGLSETNTGTHMSKYDNGLNLMESVNSKLHADPVSWQKKGSHSYNAQSDQDENFISQKKSSEQILTNHVDILPAIYASNRVEKGFLDLTVNVNSNSGMMNIKSISAQNAQNPSAPGPTDAQNAHSPSVPGPTDAQNAQSPSVPGPTDAANSHSEVKSTVTDQRKKNSSFTKRSNFSNSKTNNSTTANMTQPKSSNSMNITLISSSKPSNENIKLSLPFQSPMSKVRNLKTNRILGKYKLGEGNRYLPETNIPKHPLDKTKNLIHLNNLVKKDMMEKYRNLVKNTSLDALRSLYNLNKNYGAAFPMDFTMRPDVCNECFNQHYTYYLNPKSVCTGLRNVKILLLISSTPRNVQARNVIRETWGSFCHNSGTNLGCVFLLGINNSSNTEFMNAIDKEQEQYNDLVMANFTDSYANLTYKTMMGLNWAVDNCAMAEFIMKTDDDMYVNTELLPLLLKDAKPTKFMGGFCWDESSPHRNRNSKWYVSYQMYSNSRFPPMCSGTGYVMSRDTAKEVVHVSKNIPFFYLEDVYVALCLKQLRIRPKRLRGFNNFFVQFNPCVYRSHIITSHEINPGNLTLIWKSSRNCPMQMPEEIYQELSYFQ